MRAITDSQGREWELRMTLLHWERITARGLISNQLDQQTADFQKLVCDPVQLGRVAYCIVKEQANAFGYKSEAEFLQGMPLEDLGLIGEAAITELHDFFASLRMRLQAYILRMLHQEIEAKLNEVDTRLRESRGSAPASSASTPETTVSVS